MSLIKLKLKNRCSVQFQPSIELQILSWARDRAASIRAPLDLITPLLSINQYGGKSSKRCIKIKLSRWVKYQLVNDFPNAKTFQLCFHFNSYSTLSLQITEISRSPTLTASKLIYHIDFLITVTNKQKRTTGMLNMNNTWAKIKW